MAIRTVFAMSEGCARGERRGWQEFVQNFGGIARALLSHYFPWMLPQMDAHLTAVFRRAGESPFSASSASGRSAGNWFSSFKFANEREFMMAFRDLVFAHGREQETSISGSGETALEKAIVTIAPTALDELRTFMKDRTLLEREMLWLLMKGYDAGQIAAIMMNAAATAEAIQQVAPGQSTASARGLMESAEQASTEQCCSLKTFNDFVNGQITWRARETAEQHMADCFYCIDRFTTFQEMVRFRKDVPPLSEAEVQAILARLPFVGEKPRGVLSRLFDRTS